MGGYIVSAAAVMDGANPQNVITMFDFTREDWGLLRPAESTGKSL